MGLEPPNLDNGVGDFGPVALWSGARDYCREGCEFDSRLSDIHFSSKLRRSSKLFYRMQTATSETESQSRDQITCVHDYILRAPCPKGQGI